MSDPKPIVISENRAVLERIRDTRQMDLRKKRDDLADDELEIGPFVVPWMFLARLKTGGWRLVAEENEPGSQIYRHAIPEMPREKVLQIVQSLIDHTTEFADPGASDPESQRDREIRAYWISLRDR